MNWKITKEDGCTIYRSQSYEIVSLYEPFNDQKWQLNNNGYFVTTGNTAKELKEFAKQNERIN